MTKKFYLSVFSPIILFSLFLSGCSNSGSSPENSSLRLSTPIAIYPPESPKSYRAYLEISVADVDFATAKAVQMIIEFDGNIVDSSSWYSGDQKHVRIEIDVPLRNFKGLHAGLLGLGNMLNDSRTGDANILRYMEKTSYGTMSHISLLIIPENVTAIPVLQIGGWNPFSTFRRAFNVFIRIFGFLVDILIWFLVVVGPFLLIGLGSWWLFRIIQRHTTSKQEEK